MRRNSVFRYLFFTCACLGVVLSGQRMTAQEVDSGSANAATETEKITFSRIPADQVRTEFLHWLAATGAAPDVLQRVTQMWADDAELTGLSGEELLDLLINTFAEVDTSASRLLQESYGSGPVETPVFLHSV